jgi:peptidoglycan/LPS O-acetylase OafA/YrhL
VASGVIYQGKAAPVQRYYVLDGFRGIAALIVVLYHYVGPENYPFLWNSYIALDMFFVLSGFVIYHSYANRLRSGMSAGTYINQRFARLAPTVAIGVLFGAVATLAYYNSTGQEVDATRFALVHIGHLLFIPGLVDYNDPATGIFELFPSNGPLWSIFFEFVASVCFIWFVRMRRRALLIGSLACFLILFIGACYVTLTTGRLLTPGVGFAPEHFLLGFPRVFTSFLAGMLIYALTQESPRFLTRRLPVSRGLLPAFGIYGAMLAMLFFPFHMSGFYPFLAVAVLCPLLITVGARIQPQVRWFNWISDYLGQVSFPLYCIHVPVFLLVKTYLADAPWKIQVVVSLGAAFGASVLILALIESMRVRQNVTKLLKPVLG